MDVNFNRNSLQDRLKEANGIDALISKNEVDRKWLFVEAITDAIMEVLDVVGRVALLAGRTLNLFNSTTNNSLGIRGALLLSTAVRLVLIPLKIIAIASLLTIGMLPYCQNLSGRGFHYLAIGEAYFDLLEAKLDQDSRSEVAHLLENYYENYYANV